MAMELKPNPGSQSKFVQSDAYEALYHGTRGPGKTMALLMSFMQNVGRGYGALYTGYFVRRRFKELYDMRTQFSAALLKVYPRGLVHNRSAGKDEFILPTGEIIRLVHAEHSRDYINFHGQQCQFLAMDELTSWKTGELYNMLKSICRTSVPGLKTRIRCTTNSLGPGHSWVKEYFQINQVRAGVKFEGRSRVHYWGSFHENPYIMADRNYLLYLSRQTNKNIRLSWVDGSWQIHAGAALADHWRPESQILKPFKIPKHWRVFRTLDWGTLKPYCVHHVAVANKEMPFIDGDGRERWPKRGDVFVINEIYGWGGEPNVGTRETAKAVSRKIQYKEKILKRRLDIDTIEPGVADISIWSEGGAPSIADLMKPVRFKKSLFQAKARESGLEIMRNYLEGSCEDKNGIRESKGLFFFDNLRHTLRTLPELPRDEDNPEDADTDAEDHAYDSLRYFLKDRNRNFKLMRPA